MKPFSQPSVNTASQHFSHIPHADIPRSTFDRSHAYKTTFNAGDIIPVYWDEVLPGDTFHLSQTGFCRMSTPLRPVMDNIALDTHFFFVPYRLLMDLWPNFMGERENPDDDIDTITLPSAQYFPNHSSPDGTLWDYFGLPKSPTAPAVPVSVSAFPFRAYDLIYNEWYRDENLQDSIPINKASTPPDNVNDKRPHKRNKRRDYFTSCLPWPQKGDEVVIPLGNFAPVRGIGISAGSVPDDPWQVGPQDVKQTGGVVSSFASFAASTTQNYPHLIQEDPENPGFPLVWADLTSATAVSINDLRTAFQIQKLLERDARGGTRYIEIILSHFGVQSPDSRLQRPEYLGGDTSWINISPVAATVAVGDVAQGDLAGVGTTVTGGGFHKSFTEHGIILGLCSARADLTYQNGFDRFWLRRTRYDFYWPVFSHLGEQAVINQEIYYSGDPSDLEVFGYQERFAEYRYKNSKVTGKFSSNAVGSLDVWHLSEDFTTRPLLNSDFIKVDPPMERVLAVPDEPHFLLDVWFSLKCQRPMPVYSEPGLVDHF